jgi:hypothetical protein
MALSKKQEKKNPYDSPEIKRERVKDFEKELLSVDREKEIATRRLHRFELFLESKGVITIDERDGHVTVRDGTRYATYDSLRKELEKLEAQREYAKKKGIEEYEKRGWGDREGRS